MMSHTVMKMVDLGFKGLYKEKTPSCEELEKYIFYFNEL